VRASTYPTQAVTLQIPHDLVILSVGTYPKPNHAVATSYAQGTPTNAYSHRVRGMSPANRFERQTGVFGILPPKLVVLARQLLDALR
jgi:hypothetical protein